jgi:hypothetical protein
MENKLLFSWTAIKKEKVASISATRSIRIPGRSKTKKGQKLNGISALKKNGKKKPPILAEGMIGKIMPLLQNSFPIEAVTVSDKNYP